jgi:hypothetical protein
LRRWNSLGCLTSEFYNGSFFQLVNNRGGADAQDTCRVADPTAIEAHVDDLLLNVWKTPFVGRIQQKGRARAVGILAAIALFPGIGFAAFHDLITLTVGTKNRHEYHRIPPFTIPPAKEGVSMAHIPEKVQI